MQITGHSKPEDAIVDAALELPPAQREDYLNGACASDPRLRELVEGLLRAHSKFNSSLNSATTVPVASRPSLTAEARENGLTRASDDQKVAPVESERIGPYKLLERIGEGGCGLVYVAEQAQPVRRRVAVKVIKLGMDTRQVIARFEAERQALALMDHPNIAKVLDAGATETGRPYFVMELVKGIPITRYCDENRMNTEGRLRLFIQICQAIQHAHQKGIIHRDIKPSNILVADHDGVPVPKVIDFGIAKATTDQRLTDKTLYTAMEQFLGTPAYMSPEQAKLSGLDIDTRSDVYSLGVLLYELLTGRVPFEPKEFAEAGLEEMRRIIREKDPARPSTRLSTLDAAEQTNVAHSRQTEPPRLIHLLRGDLDWIVMKCLEKDRTRRYETVTGLGQDIERHLHNQPVTARPPTTVYRLQKLVKRNKLKAVAVGAIGLTLIVALALFISLSAKDREEQQALQLADETTHFLGEILEGAGPAKALGRDTTVLAEILAKAAEHTTQRFHDQPAAAANLLQVIAKTYEQIGDYTNGLALARETLRLRKSLSRPKNAAVADSLANIGVLLYDVNEFAEAEKTDREALNMRLAFLGSQHTNVATSYNNLGLALLQVGQYAEAEEAERKGLAIREKILGKRSLDTAASQLNLGLVRYIRGDIAQAETLFREALDICRALLSRDHPRLAIIHNNLGTMTARKGDLLQAEADFREALRIRLKVLKPNHPDVVYSRVQLASVLTCSGYSPEAEALLQQALEIDPDQAETLFAWGWLLGKKGDVPSAQKAFKTAQAIRNKLGDVSSPDLANVMDGLAVMLAAGGYLRQAATVLRDAIVIEEKMQGKEHPNFTTFCCHMAWILGQQGQTTARQAFLSQAKEIAAKTGIYGLRGLIQANYDIADALQAAGKFEEAEAILLDTANYLQQESGTNVSFKATCFQRLAHYYEAWQCADPASGRDAAAHECLRRAAALSASQLPAIN